MVRGQGLPLRVLLIGFVVAIIGIILIIAFSKQGMFQFLSAWKANVFNPTGIK